MDTRRFLVITALLTLIPPAASQGQPPAPGAVNNLSSVVRGGLVEVSYDLTTDHPSRRFSVALTVSDDEGQTFEIIPRTVSGDVGATVAGGTGKRITWEAARDVETVELGSLRYRVVATPVPLPFGVAAVLEVTSRPSGATVSVDGALRGQTPLRLDDLPPGEYRIMLTRDGYLENTQVVTLLPAASDAISVTLTAVAATQQVVEDSGGGRKLKWILPLVGGAAAAAAVLLGPGSDAITPPGERVTETLTGTVGTPFSGVPISSCLGGGGGDCQVFKFTTTTGGTIEVTLEWSVPSSVQCVDLDLYFTGSGITGVGPQFSGATVDQCAAISTAGPFTEGFVFQDTIGRVYTIQVSLETCIGEGCPFVSVPFTLTVLRPR